MSWLGSSQFGLRQCANRDGLCRCSASSVRISVRRAPGLTGYFPERIWETRAWVIPRARARSCCVWQPIASARCFSLLGVMVSAGIALVRLVDLLASSSINHSYFNASAGLIFKPRSLRSLSPSASLRSAAYRRKAGEDYCALRCATAPLRSVTSRVVYLSLIRPLGLFVTIINGLLTIVYK